MKKISIVIPVYNEKENIAHLIDSIFLSTSHCNDINFELIFVDDGSDDGTVDILKSHEQYQKNVHFVSFSRNFGHQNAIRAGLKYSSGDAVITMDGDLQHPPGMIPLMIDEWMKGADIVYTLRKTGDESIVKRITSNAFYKLINCISETRLKQGSADFRLLGRKVVDALLAFNERDIFYRGTISWMGFRQAELEYLPQARLKGTTKYTFRKMLRLAFNGITSFSLLPLRMTAAAGLAIALCSFLYGAYAIIVKLFTGYAISGWASIIAGVYFLGGVQLLALGIIGEYLGRVFLEVKKRPNYIVSEVSKSIEK